MKIASTKERILQYADYKGISKSEFYKKNELKRGILDSDKLNQSISDTFLAKIIANNKDVNPTWLLTGRGSMLLEEGVEGIKDRLISQLEGENRRLIASEARLVAENTELKKENTSLRQENKELIEKKQPYKAEFKHKNTQGVAT